MSSLGDALRTALPAETVSDDAQMCGAFAVQDVVPGCVVVPNNVSELSTVMREATAQRAAVVPWGGGTQQNIGFPPQRVDLVVRTERLNRVLIHEPDDLTISVEAGMTLSALRTHLAKHGQMLPIDPPLPDRATIGGLIATMMDGPRRLGYGTLRDLLIGVSVVEASGRTSKAGGMVVKNVSGFDMMKLYNGSFGTLAIIASANFKLLPAPRAAATVHCAFANTNAAFDFLAALHETQLTATAAEYLNAGALHALERDGTCAVAVRAEGTDAAVARHDQDIAALAERHAATNVAHIADDAALWSSVADLAQTVRLAENEAVVKLSVLPSDTKRVIEQLDAWAQQHNAPITISARALVGVVYARLAPTSPEALRALATRLAGVQWIASALPDAPRWGNAPAGLDVMQRFKAEFDPLGILNTGRFVEGI